MSRVHAASIVFVALLAAACASRAPARLHGMYVSQDDFGVLVFREDGMFGYMFPSKHEFYSEDRLPPNRGRYRFLDDSHVEVFELPDGEPGFSIETRDHGKTLVLTRAQPDGTLPTSAVYRQK